MSSSDNEKKETVQASWVELLENLANPIKGALGGIIDPASQEQAG